MTSNNCRWTLAACVRASAIAVTVLRDSEIVWIGRHRFDGRRPSPELFAAFMNRVAEEYGVEAIIVEPGTMIEVAAAALDMEIVTFSLESVWQQFSHEGRIANNLDLCNRVMAEYPQLKRFVDRLPAKGPIEAKDRRKMTIVLSVAIGLAATRPQRTNDGLRRSDHQFI